MIEFGLVAALVMSLFVGSNVHKSDLKEIERLKASSQKVIFKSAQPHSAKRSIRLDGTAVEDLGND